MKFTLLENGADSLKSAYENLEILKEIAEGGEHRLKDAVIFLNHGVELLLKYILKQRSPALMFEKIEPYLKAKQDLKKTKDNHKTVFDIDKNLRTVSLLEALKRIEYLCDVEIPENLNSTILYVNKIRNNFMHYEVELDDKETESLVTKLQVCYEEAVEFLESHIEDLDDYIQDSRFELTVEEYEEQQAEMYGEMLYEMQKEDAYIDYIEGAYEDLGEGKW
ncbi:MULTISPECIES: hypothetical protein [Bacillus subtilis group]|uniref:hypothetical protein n=1 Tax=Bacillus subtilis group TaxID=653685 RepID=UPI000BA28726|nr:MULTISPECIES: hypothetical protein [Bacillus subtilis group]ASU98578.1 hypothetical protein CJZ70_09620 [Bacillus subtilis]MDN4142202.1 hypothetical protein [Bacillus velezensis]UVW11677.1 hypothetical protein NX823_10950 [Bacillus subtilis]